MKKTLYTLALLTVLLLPGMGQAQERPTNGTVPPYTLWLPMVGAPVRNCPIVKSLGLSVSQWPHEPYMTEIVYNLIIPAHVPRADWFYPLRKDFPITQRYELYIATDPEMKNLIGWTTGLRWGPEPPLGWESDPPLTANVKPAFGGDINAFVVQYEDERGLPRNNRYYLQLHYQCLVAPSGQMVDSVPVEDLILGDDSWSEIMEYWSHEPNRQ